MGIFNISKLVNADYNFNKKTPVKHKTIEVKSIKKIENFGALFTNKPSKSQHKDLKDMVKSSSVVSGSNQTAISDFEKEKRFNKNNIKNKKKTNQLKNGNLNILKGKGIIGINNGNTKLPFKCTIINDDKSGRIINQDTNIATNGIKVASGDAVRSAQLIPGTPLGQFYNSSALGSNIKVIYIPNGRRGVNGLQIPLSEISLDEKVLFSNGALSGCMVLTATDKENLYIFHVGKDGNDTSSWKTNVDGANLILNHMETLLGQKLGSRNNGIQGLIDFCSKNLSHTTIQYCGHGEKYKNEKKINLFDYNTVQKNDPLRVGNSLTLVNSSSTGRLQISTLCDDMLINSKTCETSSIVSKHVYLKK